MSSAEKGVIEKMNASMLSISSKTDKLIESQVAITALASVVVKKIVPDYPNLPNQSFDNSRIDPKAAKGVSLAGIEAAGGDVEALAKACRLLREKMKAYILLMNAKLEKVTEYQASLTSLVKVLIEHIVCLDCLKQSVDVAGKSLSAPLPPTRGFMSDPRTDEGNVLAVGEAVADMFEKIEAELLLINSRLDKVVESNAAFADLVMALIEQIVCPDCLKKSIDQAEKSLSVPLSPIGRSDPEAVGELTERLLKAKI